MEKLEISKEIIVGPVKTAIDEMIKEGEIEVIDGDYYFTEKGIVEYIKHSIRNLHHFADIGQA